MKCSAIQWASGNPTNIMQGSVGLSNLSDYRALPKTRYSPEFFTKDYLVIRQITYPMSCSPSYLTRVTSATNFAVLLLEPVIITTN
ncbi:unnamed protein product [Acanthoscelides obtectus]|uniref:Uncharacterized protein n=1 Tax=Acanthoscelides obtectus TaxID=200917 RepID=A0A9P0M1H2_ACAOB|nr:unnamed protein product [Acanthoscelides obtectus]CAK1659842.1 hypothetical protein AOBTE_LOCUS21705 [Acanthoscelides obtectus]